MPGRWYGDDIWYGLHYDLHANPNDTDLGAHDDPRELAATLRLMNPQWVQTDCKGGAGLTSWRSQVKSASVAPGLVGDALRTWRDATRQLGTPLHAHYMSLWDGAAWEQHSEWRADLRLVDGETKRLCPRSGYVDELVIPQMLEAIEMYGVDGFWVDGEVAGYMFCYCPRCRDAFRQQTGLQEPPTDIEDPQWLKWVAFQRQTFVEFVTHYIEAVHERCPRR